MAERLLEVDHASKQYRLGMIGGGLLYRDINSWIARKLGKEDPNRKIGTNTSRDGETFMALEDISFNVDRGDALALVGRNGAGKSTMLKLISRITAPSAGEIRIHGRVASLLEVGTGFNPELTGRENVYLNGSILGMRKAEITAKMDEIVEFSEIDRFIDTPVKRYSSGMYVKLGFAVAANLAPDVLICDEVLAVGDLAFQQKCLNKMSDVARSGRAVLYVSHNMRTVSQLCNRAIFLDHGHLIYDGNTERAIELYGGAGNRDVVRDLDSMTRPRNRGDLMRMRRMVVLNSQNMEFQQDGVWEFNISCTTHVDETAPAPDSEKQRRHAHRHDAYPSLRSEGRREVHAEHTLPAGRHRPGRVHGQALADLRPAGRRQQLLRYHRGHRPVRHRGRPHGKRGLQLDRAPLGQHAPPDA